MMLRWHSLVATATAVSSSSWILFVALSAQELVVGTAAVTRNREVLVDVESYSFEDYVGDYGKVYKTDEEYRLRRTIFLENLETIVNHNSKKHPAGQSSHVLGVNQFADLRADELPMGYNKLHKQMESLSSESDVEGIVNLSSKKTTSTCRHELEALPMTVDPVSTLPGSVNWRRRGVATPVKSQGACGSCWAFASAAVLESHIALQTGTLFSLSEQELVSCAPNPFHCGGTGGCGGSTSEIAFNLAHRRGMVEEWEFGYQSYRGKKINCTLGKFGDDEDDDDDDSNPAALRGAATGRSLRPWRYFRDAVASIAGYVTLPINNYTVVMNTVAKLGPVAVSVAANPWHLYEGGVFYAPLNESKWAADVNHLVVLEGYGTDQETGEDYWLVRNSWSPRWGEDGYIRLRRVDPATLTDPEADCGMDTTPADGVSCTKDEDGNDIVPPPAKICGASGILYDASIPLGGHLV